MKLSWITDIHLNFMELSGRKVFYQNILKTNVSAVLISGDIAEAPTASEMLIEMAQHIDKQIYFVLGNHDYYHGNVVTVRKEITVLC